MANLWDIMYWSLAICKSPCKVCWEIKASPCITGVSPFLVEDYKSGQLKVENRWVHRKMNNKVLWSSDREAILLAGSRGWKSENREDQETFHGEESFSSETLPTISSRSIRVGASSSPILQFFFLDDIVSIRKFSWVPTTCQTLCLGLHTCYYTINAKAMRLVFLFPFFRSAHWVSERLSYLPEIMLPVSSRHFLQVLSGCNVDKLPLQ